MMEPNRLALLALVAAALLLAPSSSLATAIIIDGVGDGGDIAGVYFSGIQPPDSSGTGRFESFVRIQHGGSDPQFEAGYNYWLDAYEAGSLYVQKVPLAEALDKVEASQNR